MACEDLFRIALWDGLLVKDPGMRDGLFCFFWREGRLPNVFFQIWCFHAEAVACGFAVDILLAHWIRLSTLCPKQTPTLADWSRDKNPKEYQKMIAPKHILCLGAVSCQVGLYEMKVISDKTGGFMVRALDENGQFVSAASDSFCMTVYDLGSAFG